MNATPRHPLPFDEVVGRHGATVLRVCRAVLGPGPDADDAWAETFLAALRSWPTGETDASNIGVDDASAGVIDNTEAWLVRIAQRKSVDVIRARQRRAQPTADPFSAAQSSDPPSAMADVWDEVARLPERQRLAVAYHWFGGLPHAETAELTGSTPAAVRRAAADGLANLRRVLTTPTAPTTAATPATPTAGPEPATDHDRAAAAPRRTGAPR